jgi:hypothetical protein
MSASLTPPTMLRMVPPSPCRGEGWRPEQSLSADR